MYYKLLPLAGAGDVQVFGPTVKSAWRYKGPVEGAKKVFLTDTVLEDGVIYAFLANFLLAEQVAFQVWRPTSTPTMFTLVYQYYFKPNEATDLFTRMVVSVLKM